MFYFSASRLRYFVYSRRITNQTDTSRLQSPYHNSGSVFARRPLLLSGVRSLRCYNLRDVWRVFARHRCHCLWSLGSGLFATNIAALCDQCSHVTLSSLVIVGDRDGFATTMSPKGMFVPGPCSPVNASDRLRVFAAMMLMFSGIASHCYYRCHGLCSYRGHIRRCTLRSLAVAGCHCYCKLCRRRLCSGVKSGAANGYFHAVGNLTLEFDFGCWIIGF